MPWEIRFADRRRDRMEILEPRIDLAALRRRGLADVREQRLRLLVADDVRRAANRRERIDQRLFDLGERAEVIAGLAEEIATLDHAEDQVADLEEIAGMREERFPLALDLRRRMHARLVVDPGVVQLSVEQRALEALDDLELRIEPGLDRKRAQQRLAERMDRLGAKEIDVLEIATRALAVADEDERIGRADRPFARVAGPKLFARDAAE